MTALVEAPGRFTPDAVLVYGGPPHTPEWFAVRRARITATDIPAIVSAYPEGSRYARTPLHVYLDKRGELPDDDGPSHFAEAGNRLEPVIAQWWADDHGVLLHPTGVLARVGEEWMGASPDRIPDRCPDGDGPCGVEVKNRNAYVAGQWSDDVPDDVLAQVAWTMAVTGWGHVHVAALIGGNTPRWHRVDRDTELEDYLVREAAGLWAGVVDGTPPVVDPSAALARLLDALHPERAGGRLVDAERAGALYRQARLGSALEKRGKALRENAKAAAVALLGEAEELAVPDQVAPLATYRLRSRTGVDLDGLKVKDPVVHRLLVEGGYVSETSYRELRWAKRVGEAL